MGEKNKAREEAKEKTDTVQPHKKKSVEPHILHDCGEFATLDREGQRFPSSCSQRRIFESEDVHRFKTMLDQFGYCPVRATNQKAKRNEKKLFKRIAEIGLKARFLDMLLAHDAKKLKKAKKMIEDMVLVELRTALGKKRIREFPQDNQRTLRKGRDLRKRGRSHLYGNVGERKFPLMWMRRRAGNRSELLDETGIDPVC